MKHLKRWLALAASAALALSLLTGCCCTGGGISSSALAQLLSGELKNVTVASSADFDRALKAAVQTGGADAEKVQTALAEGLSLAPADQVKFTLSALESAKAGQQALNVVFKSGSDVNAAALGAAIDWLLVLRGLPEDGEYTAQVGAVRTEGGYILAIHLTVEKQGTLPPDPDPDPGPTDVGYTSDDYDVTGSEEQKTFIVKTAAGLEAWAKYTNDNHPNTNCTLNSATNTINLTGIDWTPIGAEFGKRYTGIFDGNNCTITGLTVNQSEKNYVGLFGYIRGGVVKNLTVKNPTIYGSQYVGGVVGYNQGGTITGCKVEKGTINGVNYVGGVAGSNNIGSTITACYHVDGWITGLRSIGGVVGSNDGTVTACYHAYGAIQGNLDIGGVAGENDRGTVNACYWTGSPAKDGAGAIMVNGNDWDDPITKMNEALQSVGSEWRYKITSHGLPTLTKN